MRGKMAFVYLLLIFNSPVFIPFAIQGLGKPVVGIERKDKIFIDV